MAVTAKDIMKRIQEEDIKMVDFKIVDISGQFRHVTVPAANFTEELRLRRGRKERHGLYSRP